MKNVKALADFLGEPYTVMKDLNGYIVSRTFENGYWFEICVDSGKELYSVYVWPPQGQLEIIYTKIRGRLLLKDILGYLAIRVESRSGQYRVERG